MKEGKKVLGLPVFTVSEGKRVGKVKDVVVDPQGKKVKVLLIETPTWYESYKILPFRGLQSLGEDALMVKSKAEIISLPEIKEASSLRKGFKMGNKMVVTTDGRFKGKVSDFLIEPETGKITHLEVELAKDSHRREWVSMDNFVSLGKEALIVTEEPKPVKSQESGVGSEEPADVAAEKAEDVAATFRSPEKEPKKGVLGKFLEGRQDRHLLGKKVGKDLVAQDGSLIAKNGDVITEETIKKAKETQRYLSLSFFAKEK